MSDESAGKRPLADLMIRRACSIADYRACQEAQRRAWGIDDEAYVVPIATMVGANLHGGLVLGAFLTSGEAVAMSFAFLGQVEGRLCLYSQLTGVVPAYQSRGLGYEIKLAQRAIAREEGLERIAWAFDPLQMGNAHFNLTRLGAIGVRYIEDMYGRRTDALNPGVPTDRLIVEWDTARAGPVNRAVSIAALPNLTASAQYTPFAPGASQVLIEIPVEIARLRRDEPALAERWRSAVCQAFERAFAAGYRAVAFVKDASSGVQEGFYVLER
jgi:predicted GNAT superfamily acetyltransferase